MYVTNICTILTSLVVLTIHPISCLKVDLRHQDLYNISSDTFGRYDVTKIEELNLDSCSIGNINENSFYGMTKLTRLRISWNELKHIPDKIFDQTPQLKSLDLYGNKIEYMSRNIFSYSLKSLVQLDLGNNDIFALDPRTFAHATQIVELRLSLNNLTWIKNGTFSNLLRLDFIDLSYNKINNIETNAFPASTALKKVFLHENSLQYIAPELIFNLKGIREIRLYENPWKCDRRFKPLLATLKKLRGTHNFEVPDCYEPAALAGRAWGSLQDADFPAES